MWEEVVEMAINVEAKIGLQPPSETKKIDSQYLKSYKSAKKDKDKINWEHQNENKTKSTHNLFLANIS